MGLVIFLLVFLVIRFILQMVFLKDCPNCGKTISILKSRECPGCGYMLLKNRLWKFNTAIAILAVAVVSLTALNIYSFRKETKQFYNANPYLWRGELVSSTEIDAPIEEISGSIGEETPPITDTSEGDPNVGNAAVEESETKAPAEEANPVAGVLGELFQ